MVLYVLRHASAGTRRTNKTLDVRRPLDKQGKKDCLWLGNTLSSLKVSFDRVISSPLKRSLQTASLVGTETGFEQPILLSDALAPAATFEQFQALIADCSAYESVMVVGHSPNLVQFVGMLMQPPSAGEDCAKRAAMVRMRKGAIARLNLDRNTATLSWLLDPRVVRTLYASSTIRSRRRTSRK